MSATVKKPPNASIPVDTASEPQTEKPKSKKSSKVKKSAPPSDAYETKTAPVSGETKTGAPAAIGTVSTEFPLEDIGKVATRQRWAAGFQLDAGSVRLMWIHVRRVNDGDDKKGFEVFFFAQGAAVERFRKRLEERALPQRRPSPFLRPTSIPKPNPKRRR